MESCTLPVLFVHSTGDDFVPCEMSRILYNACQSPKRLALIEGDGHGLAYLIDNDRYFAEVSEFFTQNGVETHIPQKFFET